MEQHPLEIIVRETVAAVMDVTGETLTDVGNGIGYAKTITSRRQRGLSRWTIADLGRLADHWRVPPCALLSGPSDAVSELSLDRVNELRRSKGLHPLRALPVLMPSTAASAAMSAA